MATFNKINVFVEDVMEGIHDFTNTAAAVITVALTTNANMPVATNGVLADLTEISYTNLSARAVSIASSSQNPAGTYELVLTDIVLTASGAVATFRGVPHYADFPSSPKINPLIQWYDHGSDVTLASAETFTIDYAAAGTAFIQLT